MCRLAANGLAPIARPYTLYEQPIGPVYSAAGRVCALRTPLSQPYAADVPLCRILSLTRASLSPHLVFCLSCRPLSLSLTRCPAITSLLQQRHLLPLSCVSLNLIFRASTLVTSRVRFNSYLFAFSCPLVCLCRIIIF